MKLLNITCPSKEIRTSLRTDLKELSKKEGLLEWKMLQKLIQFYKEALK
jgi:hypothetical protein